MSKLLYSSESYSCFNKIIRSDEDDFNQIRSQPLPDWGRANRAILTKYGEIMDTAVYNSDHIRGCYNKHKCILYRLSSHVGEKKNSQNGIACCSVCRDKLYRLVAACAIGRTAGAFQLFQYFFLLEFVFVPFHKELLSEALCKRRPKIHEIREHGTTPSMKSMQR